MSRPAVVTVAAGLLAITAGVSGLLLTRHATPALRPPPLGVATVPAPTGPVVSPAQPPTRPEPGHSPSADSPSRTQAPVARPVSLTIPLIGVRTPLVTLGLTANGALQVPPSPAVAGWYTGSARPGSVGPSVIAGHVDSLSGPGVFFRLSELRPGDSVYVTRADGTTVEFRVTTVQTYLKVSFPTQAVYGGTPYPELRLITCGGTFDYATGHYISNTIVYATESG